MQINGTSPRRYVLLPESNSVLPMSHPLEDRTYLLHRIQLLEMEVQDLRRREDNLKKVNLTLIEALGNKDDRERDDIKELIGRIFEQKAEKAKEQAKHYTSQEVQTGKIADENEGRDELNPENYLNLNLEHYLKHSPQKQQQNEANPYEESESFSYGFMKVRSPQTQNSSFCSFINRGCATPSYQGSKMTPTRKSFKKGRSHLDGSITGRSQSRSSFGRNIATDLLCDICGVYFTPMEFLSHVQECEGEQIELRKITDAEFSEQEQDDDGSEQLVRMLESRKNKLITQIEKLKRIRANPERKRRLETDLDQIVFIIKNKKTLNNQDIKRLLQQKNYYEKCFM